MAVAPGTPQRPTWIDRLPVSPLTGRRMICVDNNVVSNFLASFLPEAETKKKETTRDYVNFIFTSPEVQVHISRQVIDEALNNPTKWVGGRQAAWTVLAQLQESGQLVLSGVTQMLRGQQETYHALQEQLERCNLEGPDAFVVADAVVKQIPLLTLEGRAPRGLPDALRNLQLRRVLTGAGLPTRIDDILIQVPLET